MIIFTGCLAAPIFFILALLASTLAGIDEVIDMIDLPNISDFIDDIFDVVDLGPFDSIFSSVGDLIDDAVDEMVDIVKVFFRGTAYSAAIYLMDRFLQGAKAQFLGSIIAITSLVGRVIYICHRCWLFRVGANRLVRKKLQWSLRINYTLGPAMLSFVGKLS